MNKDAFWNLIDEVNAKVDRNDQEAVLLATKEKLMELPPSEIAQWDQIKETYRYLANRNQLWAACAATLSHSSTDGFIDFRYWLISQGKEIYLNAIHNPDSLANYDIPKGSANFERYGWIANEAYEIKTGRDLFREKKEYPLEEQVERSIREELHLIPDIPSDWEYSQLPEIVPKLYRKYNSEELESSGMELQQ